MSKLTVGTEVARYVGTHGTERVRKAVFAAAVPPFLHKREDNPDGGLDDATVESFLGGVRGDRVAFLDGFLTNFFAAGEKTDLISEPARRYHLDIAEFASPKGTPTASRPSPTPTSAATWSASTLPRW